MRKMMIGMSPPLYLEMFLLNSSFRASECVFETGDLCDLRDIWDI
jgi:hypothetical protein